MRECVCVCVCVFSLKYFIFAVFRSHGHEGLLQQQPLFPREVKILIATVLAFFYSVANITTKKKQKTTAYDIDHLSSL